MGQVDEIEELEGEKADLEAEQDGIEDDGCERAEEIRKRLKEIEVEIRQKKGD